MSRKNDAYRVLHEQWLNGHLKKRRGERLGRLVSGHQHGERLLLEKILYPIFGTLADLHPEYEIVLPSGKVIYADVALVLPPLYVDFEFDGFNPHAREISRERFSEERRRDLMMRTAGWQVVRVAHDDVVDRPKVMMQLIRAFMNHMTVMDGSYRLFGPMERELIRLLMRTQHGWVDIAMIAAHLDVSTDTARRLMKPLLAEGVVKTKSVKKNSGPRQRVHFYHINYENERVWRGVSGL